jgi:hypothetical protein
LIRSSQLTGKVQPGRPIRPGAKKCSALTNCCSATERALTTAAIIFSTPTLQDRGLLFILSMSITPNRDGSPGKMLRHRAFRKKVEFLIDDADALA